MMKGHKDQTASTSASPSTSTSASTTAPATATKRQAGKSASAPAAKKAKTIAAPEEYSDTSDFTDDEGLTTPIKQYLAAKKEKNVGKSQNVDDGPAGVEKEGEEAEHKDKEAGQDGDDEAE